MSKQTKINEEYKNKKLTLQDITKLNLKCSRPTMTTFVV